MSGSKEDFSSTLAGVIALFQDIHAAYTVPTGELLQQKRQTCNIRIFVYWRTPQLTKTQLWFTSLNTLPVYTTSAVMCETLLSFLFLWCSGQSYPKSHFIGLDYIHFCISIQYHVFMRFWLFLLLDQYPVFLFEVLLSSRMNTLPFTLISFNSLVHQWSSVVKLQREQNLQLNSTPVITCDHPFILYL